MIIVFYSFPENITPDSEVEPKTMTIGINNVFEVGCGILLPCLASLTKLIHEIQVVLHYNYVMNAYKSTYTLTNN